MRIMFASDIHGSAYYCRLLLDKYQSNHAERLILLGDLLYHGPRNELPREYDPRQVANLLNQKKEEILAVRGNCDAEVDQMLLDFPIMADYGMLMVDKHVFYLTHGHIFHEDNLPPMKTGDVLVHGHTHIYKVEPMGKYYLFNPGSAALPKEDNIPVYGMYDNGVLKVIDFDDIVLAQYSLFT